MNHKAIIFDMDGVIVDTEFLDFDIQRQFIAVENHEPIDPDTSKYNVLVGRSFDDLYLTLASFLKEPLPLDTLKSKFESFNEEKYEGVDYAKLFRKDIVKILKFAKEQNIKLAVASSSEHNHILEVLKNCKIESYFDVIFSGEFVEKSKPDPEIYRITLDKLGVLAENAIAIEDSAYGITAATSAGITTIAYQETRMTIDQSHADYLGKDMKEIFQLIANIFKH
ncbi:HAD family hydrolase [Enterococcus sp. AZ103]|uniref:HAD family hydrolase n=1 Tax=Enterococcus sp. AZ103 TaxID=2774628 RepID=UPI003F218F1B